MDFVYYSLNKTQMNTDALQVILLSAIILQERQAGPDYVMLTLQAPVGDFPLAL